MSSRLNGVVSRARRAGVDRRAVPPPHAVELPVLGIPTRFESNSLAVMACVEESFGGWRVLEVDRHSDMEPLSISVRVREAQSGLERDAVASQVLVRHVWTDRDRLLVQSPAGRGVADPLRRRSIASIRATLLADGERFRSMVLDALTYGLLSQFDRYPVHAAAVARGGVALLLAGNSGAGKSTLAYAAHRAGLSVLSDDHVWVQLESGLRVWGTPTGTRLLPDAAARWTEHGPGVTERRDGTGKVRFSLGARTRDDLVAEHAVVCVLAPGAPRASVEALSGTAVADALTQQLLPGFDRFPERHPRVMRALTARGGWRLHLSRDPLEALPLLAGLLP